MKGMKSQRTYQAEAKAWIKSERAAGRSPTGTSRPRVKGKLESQVTLTSCLPLSLEERSCLQRQCHSTLTSEEV